MVRVIKSAPPPAEAGTITLIGRFGYGCALTAAWRQAKLTNAPVIMKIFLSKKDFMLYLMISTIGCIKIIS
jgi:hypothetical protein